MLAMVSLGNELAVDLDGTGSIRQMITIDQVPDRKAILKADRFPVDGDSHRTT